MFRRRRSKVPLPAGRIWHARPTSPERQEEAKRLLAYFTPYFFTPDAGLKVIVGPQAHSQFNLWRWEQVIGRELMWCAPLPRDGRQGAAPEPARLPFGGPRHPQIRLRSRIGFIVRVNSVRDIGAWCQRASGARRRQN